MVAVLGQTLELDQPVWHGLFPGTVVSTDDPDKGGRVRVRVPQVYGADTEDEYVPDDQLPWARPCYPSTGTQHGEAWAPEQDAAVLVSFWGGDPERPIIVGGWYPGSKIPSEFSSSYERGAPRTRLIKTENGHVFEMRWKAGQEHIYLKTAGGSILDIVDAPALGGPKFVVTLPSGRTMGIDDNLQRGFIQTPTQSVIVDDAALKIIATSPTEILATVGPTNADLTPVAATILAPTITATATTLIQATAPQINLTTTSPAGGIFSMALLTFAVALTINFVGALILTGVALTATFAASVLTFVSLNVISVAINLGVLVNVKKLLNENYHTTIALPHQHTIPPGTDAGGGITSGMSAYAGAFVAPPLATLNAAQTSNVQAS